MSLEKVFQDVVNDFTTVIDKITASTGDGDSTLKLDLADILARFNNIGISLDKQDRAFSDTSSSKTSSSKARASRKGKVTAYNAFVRHTLADLKKKGPVSQADMCKVSGEWKHVDKNKREYWQQIADDINKKNGESHHETASLTVPPEEGSSEEGSSEEGSPEEDKVPKTVDIEPNILGDESGIDSYECGGLD
jgi:hypothetical protein